MLTTLARRRADPTRTLTLRTQYVRAMRKRFVALRRDIRESVEARDGFGRQTGPVRFQAAPERAWAYTNPADQLAAFLAWLDRTMDRDVLGVYRRDGTQVTDHDHWQERFVEAAYFTGLLTAQRQMRRAGVEVDTESLIFGGLLALPVHRQRLDLLTADAFADFQGITAAMRQQMSRAVTTGLAQEATPRGLADAITAPVATVGIRRGEQLARTGVIAAVAEGMLTEAQRQGMETVKAEVEYVFTTAGDARVCSRCAALEGKTFTISEARGMIPQHAGCRCAWRLA